MGVCLAGPDPLSAGPADPVFLRRTTGGVTIQVRVQPKARRTLLAAAPDGALKAAVTEAPEDGKANEAVAALLAEAWRLPKSTIEVVRGASARDKTLGIAGEPSALVGKITEWVRKNG